MKTLSEKFAYNETQDGLFSRGYVLGVKYYSNYGKGAPVDKQKHNEFIDDMKVAALKGHKYAKGFMCGIRDAANERKARKKK